MPLISNQWLQSSERMRSFRPVKASVRVVDPRDVWKQGYDDTAAIVEVTRVDDGYEHFLHLSEQEASQLLIGLAARLSDAKLLESLQKLFKSRATEE